VFSSNSVRGEECEKNMKAEKLRERNRSHDPTTCFFVCAHLSALLRNTERTKSGSANRTFVAGLLSAAKRTVRGVTQENHLTSLASSALSASSCFLLLCFGSLRAVFFFFFRGQNSSLLLR
jgi:hypothetical protein